jgi:hypothetical protein
LLKNWFSGGWALKGCGGFVSCASVFSVILYILACTEC